MVSGHWSDVGNGITYFLKLALKENNFKNLHLKKIICSINIIATKRFPTIMVVPSPLLMFPEGVSPLPPIEPPLARALGLVLASKSALG